MVEREPDAIGGSPVDDLLPLRTNTNRDRLVSGDPVPTTRVGAAGGDDAARTQMLGRLVKRYESGRIPAVIVGEDKIRDRLVAALPALSCRFPGDVPY